MSSYIGKHASFYDLFYSDKPYKAEAEFVHECLVRFGSGKVNRILELACGTGSHALELEKKGYNIIALDYSVDMIEYARSKAKEARSKIDFRCVDMRNVSILPEPVDAILCLFDSIGYVVTNESILRVFRNVARQLREGGVFMFEFWHAGAMLKHYEPLRIKEWMVPHGRIVRVAKTALSLGSQTANVDYSIYEFNNDGTYSCIKESQTNRFFLLKEMELLLKSGGLSPIKWYCGFSQNENITDETWHIVCVARIKSAERDVDHES